MSDELSEINGIKPDVNLADGEERQAATSDKSASRSYKLKRTADHYSCTCMAWRNQKGKPVNARTCKHLKALLGDAYEVARVELKNPGGNAPAASKAKAPAAAKPKAAGKRKKADLSDEEEDEKPPVKRGRVTAAMPASRLAKGKAKAEDEEEEEEDAKPTTRPRRAVAVKPPSKAKPASRAKPASARAKPASKINVVKKEESEGDEDAMDVDVRAADDVDFTGDELAVIDGVKPKVLLTDGEVRDVKSATSKSVYKVKRSFDHFHCSCPAWRNQKTLVNARTCKHIQLLLGEEYEAARR